MIYCFAGNVPMNYPTSFTEIKFEGTYFKKGHLDMACQSTTSDLFDSAPPSAFIVSEFNQIFKILLKIVLFYKQIETYILTTCRFH